MKIEKKAEIGKKLLKIRENAIKGIAESGTAGNLVTPLLISEILSPDYLVGTIFERTTKFTCSPDHNAVKITYAAEVDRTVAAGIAGGVKTYIIDEEGNFTGSKPAFGSDILTLNKLGIVIVTTDELLEDTVALSSFVNKQLEASLKYYVDHYIIYGDGDSVAYNLTGDQVGPSANGIVNSGNRATHFVDMSSFTLANIRKMAQNYYGGENGCWVMASDAYRTVVDLINATNSFKAFKWVENDGKLKLFLFGYPVIVKDCMNSMDIGLCDFSAYASVLIDPKTDISAEIYFDTAQQAFRSIFRINGMPTWVGGITEQNGDIRYPFVFSVLDEDMSSESTSSGV